MLDPVQVACFIPGADPVQPFLKVDVAHSGEGRKDHGLGYLFLVALAGPGLPFPGFDHAAGMGGAGGQAHDDRDVELLGDVECEAGEVLRLLRVGRAEDRHLGHQAVVAVVLLVLRRVESRVVGGDDDQAAVRADVRSREERIGRYVQADVFHRGECPRARNRGAERDLEGYLLVSGPFAIDVFVS